jgi:hypothetical protein
MPFKYKSKNSGPTLGTTQTVFTGILTPIEEGQLAYGTNINPTTLEIWYKDVNGLVTKTQDKPVTGTIVPVQVKHPTDTFAINHVTNYWEPARVTPAVIDKIADDLILGGSEWVSVHHSPFRPSRVPYLLSTIQRLRAKGLKVHLRMHYQEKDPSLFFDAGTCSSGTISSLTDSAKNWVANEWKGFVLKITSGAGTTTNPVRGYYIKGNTNNTLLLEKLNDNYIAPSIAFDSSSKYNIDGDPLMDNFFLDKNRGYYKYVRSIALQARDIGVESFSVINEFTVSMVRYHPGSIYPTDAAVIQEEHKLVQYIKDELAVNGKTPFPYGITTTDGFWMLEHHEQAGLGPCDYYEYTAYEEDSSAMYTVRRAIDKFGANKVSFGEFSLSGTGGEEYARGNIANNEDYADKLNRRIKWAKYLGVKSIFRWELWDTEGDGAVAGNGWGYVHGTKYTNNGLNEVPYGLYSDWYKGSYLKTLDTNITNWSVGFMEGRLPVKIENSSSLTLGDRLTIQFWVNSARDQISIWSPGVGGAFVINTYPTSIISKAGSYEIGIENKKAYAKIWTTDGNAVKIVSNTDFKADRWVHFAYVYNGYSQVLYINGIQVANGLISGNILNTTSPILIGSPTESLPNTTNHLYGRLQDIEICNTTIYTQNFVPPVQAPNNSTAICRLVCNEGSGTTLLDSTGKQNNGIMLGNGTTQADWFLGKYDQLVDLNTFKVVGAIPNYNTSTLRLGDGYLSADNTLGFSNSAIDYTIEKIEAKIFTSSTSADILEVKLYKLVLPNTLQEIGSVTMPAYSSILTTSVGTFIPLSYKNGDKIIAKVFKKSDPLATPIIGSEIVINILFK